MPLYEYTCCKCKNLFEALIRKKEDEADLSCPKCGAKKVAKEFSAPAIKGGGSSGSSGGHSSSSCGSCSSGSCSTCH
ncbi:MAG: zinc ribbon domain-containing protein [Planctomycetes bacterium]|nr:zinc ribbon domain-containing protein [Planctomycetota bacterium]